MRSSNARCLASNGEGGSGAGADDLLPNSAENGNRLGVWRVSVAGLAAAGGGAVPVFGNGAGTGSGTFSLTARLATAQHVAKIVTTIAATILQHRPIAVRRILGAIAIRPDLA